jgi:hypothetical protein
MAATRQAIGGSASLVAEESEGAMRFYIHRCDAPYKQWAGSLI